MQFSYSPALAAEGFGHTLLVWSDQDGNIQSQALSGGQLVASIPVSFGYASTDPQVAFYAPNKALAVWTENSLTLQQSENATLDQRVQALIDAHGRPVHAESPVLTLNASGQAQITYRALGFGAASPGAPTVLNGDALGTIIGTGELAQAFVSFFNNIITPSYLTNAGNTIWQPAAVFDPLLNQIYAVGSQGVGPTLPLEVQNQFEALGYQMAGQTAEVEPVAFIATSAMPDFSIFEVTPSTLYPQEGGDPFSVSVKIMNNGPDFNGTLQIKLAWDAPVDLGTYAGEIRLTTLDAGSLSEVEFSTENDTLLFPAFLHLPHTLYVQVNPMQNPGESNYANNQITVAIGGLPAPQEVTGVAQAGDSSVFLEWLLVEHPDVKGYRVYRSSDGQTYEPVGSSLGTGFVDLSAVPGNSYLYTVASYAGDGYELPLSETVMAVVDEIHTLYLPSISR